MSKRKVIKTVLLILSALLTAAQQIDKQGRTQQSTPSIPDHIFSEDDIRL